MDERLVQMLIKKVIAMAALEKQAAAIEDLCGTHFPSLRGHATHRSAYAPFCHAGSSRRMPA